MFYDLYFFSVKKYDLILEREEMTNSTKVKRKIYLFIFFISIIGLVWRCLGLGYDSSDLGVLTRWYNQLVLDGPSIKALYTFRGDYPLTYIFIIWLLTLIPVDFAIAIKFVSIILDYLMAYLFGCVAEELYPANKESFCLGYSIVMILPTVIMNSGFWGQSDCFYAAFLMGVILCLLKGKYIPMMIFLGIAFSYKLQTIFILPFIMIYYWCEKKISAVYFLIVPGIMLFMNIPAMVAGYSPMITFSQFIGQSGAYPWLYYYYPNFWLFFQAKPYYRFGTSAMLLTIVALLIFVVLLVKKNIRITNQRVLPMVIWIMYTCAMFLPAMHERYTYMPEILSVLYGIKDKKKLWLPIGLQIAIVPKYLWTMGFVQNTVWSQVVTAIICVATYLTFTVVLFKDIFYQKEAIA